MIVLGLLLTVTLLRPRTPRVGPGRERDPMFVSLCSPPLETTIAGQSRLDVCLKCCTFTAWWRETYCPSVAIPVNRLPQGPIPCTGILMESTIHAWVVMSQSENTKSMALETVILLRLNPWVCGMNADMNFTHAQSKPSKSPVFTPKIQYSVPQDYTPYSKSIYHFSMPKI